MTTNDKNLKHVYCSIAAYAHDVYKYVGAVEAADLDFWREHFRSHNPTGDSDATEVLILDEDLGANRITFFADRAQAPAAQLPSYRDSGIKLVAREVR